MATRLFGTDGIRGQANSYPMTAEMAMKVGMAAGQIFTKGDHRHRVVIGKDTRLSGYMIESALISGFTSVGMDVFLLGPMPTPAVAMLTRSLRADLGVMISASHNPYQDNGIKLFDPEGFKLSDEIEAAHRGADRPAIPRRCSPRRRRIGRAKRIDERAGPLYRIRQAHARPHDLRLDGLQASSSIARNGAAYKVAPQCAVGARRRRVTLGVDAGRLQHQRQLRLDRARRAVPQGARSSAPISASRSTATPTASIIVDENGQHRRRRPAHGRDRRSLARPTAG